MDTKTSVELTAACSGGSGGFSVVGRAEGHAFPRSPSQLAC